MSKRYCCVCRLLGKNAKITEIKRGDGVRVELAYFAKDTNRHLRWIQHLHGICYTKLFLHPLVKYPRFDSHKDSPNDYKDSYESHLVTRMSLLVNDCTPDPEAQIFREDETRVITSIKITDSSGRIQEKDASAWALLPGASSERRY